jgi:CRISPR-associated DxTHG motif protein
MCNLSTHQTQEHTQEFCAATCNGSFSDHVALLRVTHGFNSLSLLAIVALNNQKHALWMAAI